MALSSREIRIAWLTVAVVGGVVLWVYAIGPIYESYLGYQEKLSKELKLNQENRKLLAQQPEIEANFRRIEAMFPKDDPSREPAMKFQEDVDAAVQSILPGARRVIEVVQHEPMKDVNEYEFLTVQVKSSAELPKIAQLLKGFDQNGFLIKNITLDHVKNDVDNEELNLVLTLARIVKIEKEEQTDKRHRKRGSH